MSEVNIMENKNEAIEIKKSELEGLFNLSRELEHMLVDDYYYSFDLRTVGDYIAKLRQLLQLKLMGRGLPTLSLIELEKKDNESRKNAWKQLKKDWKIFGCYHCGFLRPNIFGLKRNGDPETLYNYKGDKDLIKASWEINK